MERLPRGKNEKGIPSRRLLHWGMGDGGGEGIVQNRARIRFLATVFRLICGKYTDFRIDVSLFARPRVC